MYRISVLLLIMAGALFAAAPHPYLAAQADATPIIQPTIAPRTPVTPGTPPPDATPEIRPTIPMLTPETPGPQPPDATPEVRPPRDGWWYLPAISVPSSPP